MINRRTWAEINLDEIVHNYNLAKELSGNKNVIAVIKANAYGHGAVSVAQTLVKHGANTFAVATLDEALELRQNGIDADIIILGATLSECFSKVIDNNIIQEVSTVEYAMLLNSFARSLGKKARVHIKLDTGMGRIGFCARRKDDIELAANQIATVCKMDSLSVEGIFTHFATADIPDNDFAKEQLENFRQVCGKLSDKGVNIPHKHVSNSGRIVNYEPDEFDMVREGIILYGYQPDKQSKVYDFHKVMCEKSVISHISHIRKGETIGYGRTFTADRDIIVGVVPVGYADGYPRMLSNKGYMLVNGNKCPILGRVCMDQTMIDITGIDVVVGDTVIIMGKDELNADTIADFTDTINYEVLCDVSARVPRVYFENGKFVEM